MKVIYDIRDGKILSKVSDEINISIFCKELPQDYIDNINEVFIGKEIIDEIKYYYVKDGVLTRHKQDKIDEIKKYGKILSEKTKLYLKLNPSRDEITKAESTIEILEMLLEVGII